MIEGDVDELFVEICEKLLYVMLKFTVCCFGRGECVANVVVYA